MTGSVCELLNIWLQHHPTLLDAARDASQNNFRKVKLLVAQHAALIAPEPCVIRADIHANASDAN